MPTDRAELERRLAVFRPKDRVRGVFFNVVFKLVEKQSGDGAVAKVKPATLPEKLSDLQSYPATDFARMLYDAADLLEPKYGSVEAALRACGEAGVDSFAATGAGSLFLNILGRADP